CPTGKDEGWSPVLGRKAIAELLGERNLIEAVDCCVHWRRGYGVARSVLQILRPPVAMQRCLEIYRNDQKIEVRRAAVALLESVGDRAVLAFVRQFWEDPDEGIQNWGVGVVDHLLFSGLISIDEAEEYLKLGENHPNPTVRETVGELRSKYS
ncbi:MAG TPA: HEAT repeat domain-containing protein, partial [Bryobacteraceae bacterium]|nr:HEAT repeat domain-containing protein [Bryobacteraceae bacterium]